MPTSVANITRDTLIRRAFKKIGIDNPATSDLADAVGILNLLLKEVDSMGRFLWTVTNTESTLTLSASTRAYSAGSGAANIATDILEFETVQLLKGSSYVPIRVISKTESLTTYEREGTGEPYLVHLEKAPLMANQRALFYPTPGASYTVKYHYRRRLYDFEAASDNPDFPQDWGNRLVDGLAWRMAPEYGVPLQEREYLKADWQSSKREGLAASAERPDPTPVTACYF